MLYFLILIIFLFGLSAGSFLNCLIWRLRKKESILGRSYCPKCGEKIVWYDNIPVLSFVLLLGRCRHCREKISWQYPVIEFLSGFLFVFAFLANFQFTTNIQYPILLTLRDWFVISVMIVVFVYDLRWYLILDIVTLPAVVIIFLINLYLGLDWQNLLISGIIGGGFFFSQFIISRGKWIGGGDIRLGFLMGVILGWPNILAALFLAYLAGAIAGIFLISIKEKKWGSEIPFGVFLTAATVICLYFGQGLIDWYLAFF